jgi:hypothetical protein
MEVAGQDVRPGFEHLAIPRAGESSKAAHPAAQWSLEGVRLTLTIVVYDACYQVYHYFA